MNNASPIFLDLLLDAAPVGLAFVDLELRFRHVNTALALIDGPSVTDHIGRTIAEVLPELAPQLTSYYQQVMSRKQAIVGLEVSGEVPSAPGEIKHWLVNYYPVAEPDGTLLGVGVVVQDITERKQAEQREHTRLQVLELVAKGRPLPEILDAMVRSMEAENPAMVGSILLLDEEGRHLLYGAAPSLPESFSRAIHGAAIGSCAGSCGTAAFRGEQVIVSDIARDPLWADYRALILPHGFNACWSQPILSGAGRVLGTFAMYYRTPRSPSRQDLDIINTAANIAAIAIEHDRGRQALATACQQLESKEARLKQTLQAMEQSETKYRTVFESSSDAIMLFDGKAFLDCNNATLRIFGCRRRDQFIGTHPAAWAPALQPSGEDSQRLAQAQIDTALKEGSNRFESVRQRLDGSQFPAEIWLTRMEMDGKPIILATVRDISERKTAEQALQASEARLRNIFEQASDGIFLIAADNHYLDVNACGLELFGYTREEFLQMNVAEVIVPHERPRLDIEPKEMLAGKPHLAEWEHLRRDGSTFPAEVSARRLNDQTYLAIVRDLTDRRRAEAMLRESEAQLRLFIEYAPAAIAMFGRDMHYLTVSRRWRTDYGLGDQTIIGHSHYEIFPEIPQRWKEIHQRCLAGATEKCEEDPFPRVDGTTDWVRWEVRSWLRNDGKIGGIIIFSEDITERKQAEHALHQLNLELEQRVEQRTQELTVANTRLLELDRLKSLFIASMSHELRTPLNSIIGFTGIILQGMSGEINAEQRKQLGIVKNNARHLLDLINDIIDVSKIESGAIELADEAFDLTALVQETSQALATAAAGKNLMLSLQVPPVLAIHSDRRRLKQILINLLDNAIKFTDAGSVDIALTLHGSQVILSVHDSGIGIDTQHQGRLFHAFSQIAPPSGRVHQGTGLGLYLSQRLAHLLGGEITLTSAADAGSRFTLTLPYRKNQKP